MLSLGWKEGRPHAREQNPAPTPNQSQIPRLQGRRRDRQLVDPDGDFPLKFLKSQWTKKISKRRQRESPP